MNRLERLLLVRTHSMELTGTSTSFPRVARGQSKKSVREWKAADKYLKKHTIDSRLALEATKATGPTGDAAVVVDLNGDKDVTSVLMALTERVTL